MENADEYAVYQGEDQLQQSTETSYTAEGLEPETTYTFSVTASNDDGESDPATVECTTSAEVVTDPPLG